MQGRGRVWDGCLERSGRCYHQIGTPRVVLGNFKFVRLKIISEEQNCEIINFLKS